LPENEFVISLNKGLIMKIRLYVVVVAIAALCFFYTKEAPAQSTKIKVAVEIFFSGENASNLEMVVANSVKNELRSSNDVVVVDKNEDFKLYVNGMEMVSADGQHRYGYALSVIGLALVNYNNSPLYAYSGSTMYSTAEDGLSSASDYLVQWFNQTVLDYARKYKN
jgi:hypothetical protein